jgi:hypothetical protein
LFLNGKAANLTVLNNAQAEINATLAYPESGNLMLWLDNFMINSGNNLSNITVFDKYGLFNVTAYFAETELYYSSFATLWIDVINDTIAPKWGSSKIPPTMNYSQDQSYQFNVTWFDNVYIDTVIIEHNFSGVMGNYSVNNSNNGEYYYDWRNLKAGDYSFRWRANDSSGNWNITDLLSFKINKKQSSVRLEINGKEGNVTSKRKNIDIEADLIAPEDGNLTIKKDSSLLAKGESPIDTALNLSAGEYKISAIYDGDENHTSVEILRTLVVNLTQSSSGSSSAASGAGGAAETVYAQCTENWICVNWSACINNMQTRICADINRCGTNASMPVIQQACSCAANWQCGDWNECVNGTQTRVCSDLNNCLKDYPSMTQSCTTPNFSEKIKNLPASTATGIQNLFSYIKEKSLSAYTALKEKPVILAFIFLSVLTIVLIIRISPPLAKYIRSVKIVRKARK